MQQRSQLFKNLLFLLLFLLVRAQFSFFISYCGQEEFDRNIYICINSTTYVNIHHISINPRKLTNLLDFFLIKRITAGYRAIESNLHRSILWPHTNNRCYQWTIKERAKPGTVYNKITNWEYSRYSINQKLDFKVSLKQ